MVLPLAYLQKYEEGHSIVQTAVHLVLAEAHYNNMPEETCYILAEMHYNAMAAAYYILAVTTVMLDSHQLAIDY